MSKCRVLIVDGSSLIRKQIRKLLSSILIEYHEVENPAEALKVLERESFDLLILDVLMPRMDGVELLSTLQTTNLVLPVILMPDYPGLPKELTASLENDIVRIVLNPFQEGTLLSVTKAMLEVDTPQLNGRHIDEGRVE